MRFVWSFLCNAELTPMPTIYRITTDEDDEEEKASLPTGAAGAVIMNGEQGGQFVSFHLALRKDGKWIPIRHPIEDSDLEANGETFSTAKKKGILWHRIPFICLECGERFYQPKIYAHFLFGCSIPILVGIMIAIVSWLALELNFGLTLLIGFIAVVGTAILLESIGKRVAKEKMNDEEKKLILTQCDKCGSHQLKSIGSLSGRTVTLGTGKKVSIFRAGIS